MPEKLCRWTEQDFKNSILLSLFHVLFKAAKAIRSHQNWFLNPQVCSWEGFFHWEGSSSTSVASGDLFWVGKSAHPTWAPAFLWAIAHSTTFPVFMGRGIQQENSAGRDPVGTKALWQHQLWGSGSRGAGNSLRSPGDGWMQQAHRDFMDLMDFTWTHPPGDSNPRGWSPLLNSLSWVCQDICGPCPGGRGCAKVL